MVLHAEWDPLRLGSHAVKYEPLTGIAGSSENSLVGRSRKEVRCFLAGDPLKGLYADVGPSGETGRRTGLKIPRRVISVRVRFPPRPLTQEVVMAPANKRAFRTYVLEHHSDGTVTVHGRCVITNQKNSVTVNALDLEKFKNGEYAQTCFPYLKADDREFLISGISGAGWSQTFPDEE